MPAICWVNRVVDRQIPTGERVTRNPRRNILHTLYSVLLDRYSVWVQRKKICRHLSDEMFELDRIAQRLFVEPAVEIVSGRSEVLRDVAPQSTYVLCWTEPMW